MELDKLKFKTTGKSDGIKRTDEESFQATDSSTIPAGKDPITTCSDEEVSQTGFQAIKEIQAEDELAKSLTSKELKSFCNEFDISFSALRTNLSKMNRTECDEFRRTVRLRPHEVTRENFKALVDDEQITLTTKILGETEYGLTEDQVRLFLAKVEENDLALVVQGLREAQNTKEPEIERIILEAFDKELIRISNVLNIPHTILKECIKPEFNLCRGGIGMFDPITYTMIFSVKRIQDGLLTDLYSKYTYGPNGRHVSGGISDRVTDVVAHECKHLEQALRNFLNLPKEDTLNVINEIWLEEIRTGNPSVIYIGDSSGGFLEVPRLTKEAREELTVLMERMKNNPSDHGLTEQDFDKIIEQPPERQREIAELNRDKVQEVITENNWGKFGDDSIGWAMGKIYKKYWVHLRGRPTLFMQTVNSPYRNNRLAPLKQFVNPKPIDKETLKKEVKAMMETFEANLKGGIFGIKTHEEYLAYLNSPYEVEARTHSAFVRVNNLQKTVAELANNRNPKDTLSANRKLRLIENELSRESTNFTNPQTVELKQQLYEINEMLKDIKDKLAA